MQEYFCFKFWSYFLITYFNLAVLYQLAVSYGMITFVYIFAPVSLMPWQILSRFIDSVL
jgi:hypothetical protein